MPGINPAIYKDKFDKQLMALVPQIEARRNDLMKQGKNPLSMFDEKSPDYVGKDIKPLSFDEAQKALITSTISSGASGNTQGATINPGATQISNPNPEKPKPKVYANYKDLLADSPNLTQEQFLEIGRSKGFFSPGVPRPK